MNRLKILGTFYVLIRILGDAGLYKYELPTHPVGTQNLAVGLER